MSTTIFSKCGILQLGVTLYLPNPAPTWSRRPPSRMLRNVRTAMSTPCLDSASPTTSRTASVNCSSRSRNESFAGVGNFWPAPHPPFSLSKVEAIADTASSI